MHIVKSESYKRAPQAAQMACLKLLEWAHRNKLRSVDMVIADETYYDKSLEERRVILKAPSTQYLCKTIILENTAYDQKFAGPHYPRYICVVFQYITKFHSQKLARLVKHYQNRHCQLKASNKSFHYRLVDEKLSVDLSGYEHNGVVPIQTKVKMPTIISHRIEQLHPQFFWLGGGHPITKLRISLEQFIRAADAPVLNDIRLYRQFMDYDPNEIRIVEKNLHKKLSERLRLAQKEEDVLLDFMVLVEQKLPLLHFLSNVVLMIWLSQTVLSSNLREIPRSIYLIAPLFDRQPLQNIETSFDGRCPTNFEVLRLGSAPEVLIPKLKHQNFTHWKDSSAVFCGERLRHVAQNATCSKDHKKCSGYCIPSNQQCPVTGIRMIDNLEDKRFYETVFYESSSHPKEYLVLSRLEGQPILELMAFVNETCANQFYYGDEFERLKNFTSKIRWGCGSEGNLDEITQKVDSQPYRQLLRKNGYIYSEDAEEEIGELSSKLHYIHKLKLDQDNPYCKAIMKRAFTLESMLPSNPHLPQFTNLLLITSLIYMVLSLVWWVASACGLRRFGKQAAVFISAVELLHFIIIKSRYSQHLAISGLTEIQNCVKNSIEALKHWEFGIGNPYIFKVVVFENTVFLAFEVLVGVLLRVLYHEI